MLIVLVVLPAIFHFMTEPVKINSSTQQMSISMVLPDFLVITLVVLTCLSAIWLFWKYKMQGFSHSFEKSQPLLPGCDEEAPQQDTMVNHA